MSTFAQAEAGSEVRTKATIGEITELSREVLVEQLKKELREAKKESDASAPPPAPGGVATLPPLPPVKITPPTPVVSAVYGSNTEALRVRLANGMELGKGEQFGEWRISTVTANGVTFERCETVRPAKGSKVVSECTTRFVAPRG
jgi:hypothetical protein